MQRTGFGLKAVQILQTEPRDKGLSSLEKQNHCSEICTLLLWPFNPSGSWGRVFNPYQWDPSDIRGDDHYHHSALCSLQVENIKAMNSEHLEYSLKALILQSENVTHGHRWCLSNILPTTPLGLAPCLPWLRPLIKSLGPPQLLAHLLCCLTSLRWRQPDIVQPPPS